jgi:aminoglycoside phosphotransferase (APT) family kinase protein
MATRNETLDAGAVAVYLRHVMPAARDVEVRGLRRIFGGASRHTWSLDASWTEGEARVERGLIIRLDPAASLLDSDRELEFNVYRGLAGSAIPVPEALWHEPSPEWLGGAFFVMGRVDGCEPGHEGRRPVFTPGHEAALERLGQRHFEVGGLISAFDWRAAGWTFLEEPPPGGCWRRELEHWERVIEKNRTDAQPIVRLAIAWLRAHPPPAAQRVALVHGDYRLGNLLNDSSGEIRAVLDWEMTHLGDPLEDLAWTCMPDWRRRHPDYPGGLMPIEDAHAIWSRVSGLRVDPEGYRWWEIFSQVKAIAIWLTGGRSFADGRTDDGQLAIISTRMTPVDDERTLAMLGWRREGA